jgi:hypothetical protein
MAAESTITWWALVSAFGGSIIGAVLGGTINYILQTAARAEAKKQRDADKKEVQIALAYSFLFKMIKVVSGLKQLGRSVRESLDEAASKGFTGAPWRVVLPVVNPPEPIRFTAEEMGMVLSLDDKIFNAVAAFDELHNSTAAIFVSYSEGRAAITERFGATMEGNIGSSYLTEKEALWLAPREVELNGLVDAMLQRTEQDYKESVEGLKAVHGLFERELGIKKKLEFV